MSSVIPKYIRRKMSAKRPTKFEDVDSTIQYICRVVKIIINADCKLYGSHYEGIPAPDSDLDISVEGNVSKVKKKQVEEFAKLNRIKIDLGNSKEGFDII